MNIKEKISQEGLAKQLRSLIGPQFPGAILAVADSKDIIFSAAGNISEECQYFIASATKLYTTALVLQLVDSNRLSLNDKIASYLDSEQIAGLHFYKGIEYSRQITIEQLLSHTSGLPDYFQDVGNSKPSLKETVLLGEDKKWDLVNVLSQSKAIGAKFPPSFGEKAHYSDTNFQLLGEIIAKISGHSLATIIQSQICHKIGLKGTYMYHDPKDGRPAPLNYKDKVLNIPLAMTSFGPDGGIVSTASDGIIFLRAFFGGKLFNQRHLANITSHWRNIFFPLKYGIGISLFRLPWYFSPFKKFPDLIGHSGLSGAFLFYCPEKGLYFSGTVNQMAKPQTSFRLMLQSLR